MIIKQLESLRKRYEECNSNGHLKPDKENNYCNNCYRHLDYNLIEFYLAPNTPQPKRKIKKSIKRQMRIDYFNGLEKVVEEGN
ncbi:MAG: hypothetical protein Q7S33_04325 [Nanoarchaeota archaeon]|nr:hypothetical protein [Nanoarchaeota archaeon]